MKLQFAAACDKAGLPENVRRRVSISNDHSELLCANTDAIPSEATHAIRAFTACEIDFVVCLKVALEHMDPEDAIRYSVQKSMAILIDRTYERTAKGIYAAWSGEASNASAYDDKRVKGNLGWYDRNEKPRFAEIIANLGVRGDVIDLGSGRGWLLIYLAELFGEECTFEGFDLSEEGVKASRKHAKQKGVDGRVTFTEKDVLHGIEGVGENKKKVVCSSSFLHTPDQETVQRLHEQAGIVLESGGKYVNIVKLTLPDSLSPEYAPDARVVDLDHNDDTRCSVCVDGILRTISTASFLRRSIEKTELFSRIDISNLLMPYEVEDRDSAFHLIVATAK